ncbi:hypothetical protein [Beijerinckia indica]|uniref:hypothetical protein n=1 Tax=Beijerinckia indica TaxID=533 RepID=UPI0011D148D8|nr:hypothetical protein [Beijerinckia indica]
MQSLLSYSATDTADAIIGPLIFCHKCIENNGPRSMKLSRSLLFGSFLVAFNIASHDVVKAEDAEEIKLEEEQARLKKEAEDLFRSVLADEPKAERCEIEAEWGEYSIPESVARQYLGLKIHADLSPPYSETKPYLGMAPKDIIHPSNDALCSKESTKEREKASGINEDKAIDIHHISYTFPVFDDNYNIAIIVITSIYWSYRSIPGAGIIKMPPEGEGSAAIYAKSLDGVWRRITTINLFHFS